MTNILEDVMPVIGNMEVVVSCETFKKYDIWPNINKLINFTCNYCI